MLRRLSVLLWALFFCSGVSATDTCDGAAN
jgi:hypothetical protein